MQCSVDVRQVWNELKVVRESLHDLERCEVRKTMGVGVYLQARCVSYACMH